MNKKAGGIVAVILAALVAGGCIAGYCSRDDYGTWFQESDIKKWSWNKDAAPEDNELNIPVAMSLPRLVFGVGETSGNVQTGYVAASRVSGKKAVKTTYLTQEDIVNAEREAEVTVKLSSAFISDGVSLETSNAEAIANLNVPIEWTFAWKDNSAHGDVTGCLSVTANSDFTRTAKIKMLQPFTSPIIVTARLSGTDKSTQMQVDTLTRFTEIRGDSVGAVVDFGQSMDMVVPLSDNADDFTRGTIWGNFNISSCSYTLRDDFKARVQEIVRFDVEFLTDSELSSAAFLLPDLSFRYGVVGSDVGLECIATVEPFDITDFIKNGSGYTEGQINALRYAWYKAAKEFDDSYEKIFGANIDIRYSYNGYDYGMAMLCAPGNIQITGAGLGAEIEESLDMSLVNKVL